jgi:hypothetical protein
MGTLPKYSSDQNPLILTSRVGVQTQRLFRFERSWVSKEDFQEFISKWWSEF